MVAMKYGFVIGVLIIGIATSLFADTIYFKNKETINGVIEKESAKEIVIDVGAGKFTFLRSEIDRIEKDALGGENAGEDNRLNASRDADVSSQLSVLMSTVRKERMLLARDKRKYDNIKRKIRLFEDTLARHYKEYEALAEENKQDTKKLKRHMTFAEKTKQGNRREEMNVINAKTRNYELKIRRFEHEKDIVGIKVSQSFGVLKTAIETLTVHYEKMVRENPEQQYESIKTMIDQFYDDVLQKGIPLRQQGKNFIADVRLNDALVIPLIVDTGASTVCISRATAERLGITRDDEIRTVTGTLADGSTAEGRLVYLDSIELGGMRVEHVETIIFGKRADAPIEGLLGMTYLDNFNCRIDTQGKKLILERYEPR